MATLKSLVDETINIKNELVECRDTLKQILINKEIEVLESENKLSNLIDEVREISTPINTIIGENYQMLHDTSEKYNELTEYVVVLQHTMLTKGYVTAKASVRSGYSGAKTYMKIVQRRGSVIIKEEEIESPTNEPVYLSVNLETIPKDVVEYHIKANTTGPGRNAILEDQSIKCNLVL